MCDRLAHRGPDGHGRHVHGPIALGHRRLSIIDLAGGHQPLGNEDDSLQIVFNGEIYNYLELRPYLLNRGHHFRTQSDTEVMVHLFEEHGEQMLEQLNGMFALAIWDQTNQELLVARDRFGKKPLYYTTQAPGFVFAFASELKALLALPDFAPRENARAVADFLACSYVPEPETIFDGICKLPPGSWMRVSASGEVSPARRYWRLAFGDENASSFSGAMEELNALSSDAVQRRMISDVPLGAFLSGGVDSSAVVAHMSGFAPEHVKTFSIGFTSKAFDETEYARMIVDRYHTQHFEQQVSPSLGEMLDTLTRHFDEPFGDDSAIPSLYLSRMTRQHVTVALSGDGADEIFGGYRRYRFGVLEERFRQRMPEWFRHSVLKAGGALYPKLDFMPRVFRAKTTLQNLSSEIGDAYFTSMSAFRDRGLRQLLSPDLLRSLNGYDPRVCFRDRFRKYASLTPLRQMQAVDLETWLPGDILVKGDRTSMAYSLESRAPWLDYRIAELAARWPEAWLVQQREGKYLFKKSLQDRVPADILWRPKMGFSMPVSEWLRTDWRPLFEATVLSGTIDVFVQRKAVQRLWAQHQSGRRDHGRKLWNLLMLACWHRTWGSGATDAQKSDALPVPGSAI